jgi:hypothetical protein
MMPHSASRATIRRVDGLVRSRRIFLHCERRGVREAGDAGAALATVIGKLTLNKPLAAAGKASAERQTRQPGDRPRHRGTFHEVLERRFA